jgi:1-aminocyclopropane-1-carboxylate deaminase/D-cysteine desulfhydrase-like pyridoxal-dependent ACC family enzyme
MSHVICLCRQDRFEQIHRAMVDDAANITTTHCTLYTNYEKLLPANTVVSSDFVRPNPRQRKKKMTNMMTMTIVVTATATATTTIHTYFHPKSVTPSSTSVHKRRCTD